MNPLIRMARQILESVLSQLTQQFNVVQEQALSPVRAIVQEVTGGVWKGESANAFVQQASSMTIPGIGTVCDNITFMNTNIQYAMDVVDQADAAVHSKVDELADTFDNIYRA